MTTKSPLNPRRGRRRFLQQGALAAITAVALPRFVRAAVLGRNRAVPHRERITMGFIGVGGQGGGHFFDGAWT